MQRSDVAKSFTRQVVFTSRFCTTVQY